MFYVVLNEQVLEQPHPTAEAADQAAQDMVKALAERGEDAGYVIWAVEKVN